MATAAQIRRLAARGGNASIVKVIKSDNYPKNVKAIFRKELASRISTDEYSLNKKKTKRRGAARQSRLKTLNPYTSMTDYQKKNPYKLP